MGIPIGQLSSEVMKIMEEYSQVTTEGTKKAVRKAGKTCKDEIQNGAPKKTGGYSKSYSIRTDSESSTGLHLTIYSPKYAWLGHLLENGHGLHQGGRARAFPHIGPAEEIAVEELEADIMRMLKNG